MRDLSRFFTEAARARAEVDARWDAIHGEVYEWLK